MGRFYCTSSTIQENKKEKKNPRQLSPRLVCVLGAGTPVHTIKSRRSHQEPVRCYIGLDVVGASDVCTLKFRVDLHGYGLVALELLGKRAFLVISYDFHALDGAHSTSCILGCSIYKNECVRETRTTDRQPFFGWQSFMPKRLAKSIDITSSCRKMGCRPALCCNNYFP